jgi:hypothetical protein
MIFIINFLKNSIQNGPWQRIVCYIMGLIGAKKKKCWEKKIDNSTKLLILTFK